jgi:hypothetical protein
MLILLRNNYGMLIFYFDDGLMTYTFGDYLYIMRYYVYFGVWKCNCFLITLYS